jgi:signal transduction histidine kinase
MIKKILKKLTVRQRIALWCIGLSAFVYITPTILGFFFFYFSLTAAMDHELKSLASSLGHAIDLRSGRPQFRDWARVVQTNPARSLATIQLYDINGQMLEHYGTPGISRLIIDKREVIEEGKRMRIMVTPLVVPGHKTIGYLQFELPTHGRDAAVEQFVLVMALIAPIVLLGLGICSYLVSDKATIPIQQTIGLLRQFISDAGHELNTPLSIINACAEALERKLDKQGIKTSEVTTITNSAERMQHIIDALMLLAELETPITAELIQEPVLMSQLVNQCLEEFSVKYAQKGIHLKHPTLPDAFVLGDKSSLQTMLSNLLENALRYTEAGGTVEINVNINSPNLIISVSDTGIGIAQENLSSIFNRFYRIDKSRSRLSGGAGLGLSIVKAIVESHQGTIDVSSTLGAGTKFTISLPLHNLKS